MINSRRELRHRSAPQHPQVILSGELLDVGWTPPGAPIVALPKPTFDQLISRCHDLAQASVNAENEAQARAMLQMKSLQDEAQALKAKVSALGARLEAVEDEAEHQKGLASVRFLRSAMFGRACCLSGFLR